MYHSAWEVQRRHECYNSYVARCADHNQCNILTAMQYNVIMHLVLGNIAI